MHLEVEDGVDGSDERGCKFGLSLIKGGGTRGNRSSDPSVVTPVRSPLYYAASVEETCAIADPIWSPPGGAFFKGLRPLFGL